VRAARAAAKADNSPMSHRFPQRSHLPRSCFGCWRLPWCFYVNEGI